jgi:ferrous iron transport protein A
MDLTLVKEGKYRIIGIQGGYNLLKKLEKIGIREGVEIVKITSEFATGPVVIQVGNTELAIGHGMAKKIIVEKIE